MKITDMRTFVVGNPWKNWIFVKLYTDEGVEGLGEATGGLSTKPIVGALEELKHQVIGLDPRDIVRVRDVLHKALFLGDAGAAGAGIDCACWDILGKSLNAPVYRLLGGKMHEKIRVYANGWYQGPRDPVFFAERAKEIAAMGYTALKFDPFGNAYMYMSREEERLSMRIIGAIRGAVGQDVDILIEGHDRFSVSEAIRLGNMMAEYEPMWFETPCFSPDVDAVNEVARRIPVPVISGERAESAADVRRALEGRAINMANPEYLGVGGITGLQECFHVARAFGAYLAPHNAQSPVSTAINVHVGTANENLLIQECFDDSSVGWTGDVLSGFPVVRDGFISVSEAPGLGVALNEAEALKHPYGERNFLRLFESGWERRNS
jgi:galactonate dehydratase